MDFKNLNTKNDNESGAFLHLTHPVMGHLLYNGWGDGRSEGITEHNEALSTLTDTEKKNLEAVGVICRGFEAPSVQEALEKARRKRLKDKNYSATDEGYDVACAIIVEFVGFYDSTGQKREATRENKLSFLRQSDDIVRQIESFAKVQSNFFGSASRD